MLIILHTDHDSIIATMLALLSDCYLTTEVDIKHNCYTALNRLDFINFAWLIVALCKGCILCQVSCLFLFIFQFAAGAKI